MAVVSAVATILLSNGLGSTKRWQATAAAQDTAAGSSTVVTVTRLDAGATPPGDPDTFTLAYLDDAGAVIKSVTLANTSASQTDTFFFTDTGLTSGAARCGTVELRLRATKTTGGIAATYDVASTGAPNVPPTTFTATQLDRGWVRGTTTLVQAVSNVALGGAKNEPADYRESLFVRTTAGAVSYVASTITVASSVGALSAVTNSTTAVTRDATFASAVTSRFAAGSTVISWTTTPSNATLTGLPSTVFTATTPSTIIVDPRLSVSHLLQLDDSAVGTPPLSKGSTTGQRLTTQIGYTDTNFRGARGTRVGNVITRGVNGLDFSVSLQDAAANTTALTRSVTTLTQGGEAGWGPGFLQWTSQLPGGAWAKTVTLQGTVTDLTNAYLVGATATYTLLALNPNVALRGYANKMPGGTGPRGHFVAGVDGIYATLVVVDGTTGVRIDPSRVTAPGCTVSRVNTTTQQSEILGADEATFAPWGATDPILTFPMAVSPADPRMYVKSFPAANTATWSRDMRFGFTATIDGTPYYSFSSREETGAANDHTSHSLDAVGLALSGQIGFK